MWSLWLASFTENILGFTHILKCISTSLFDAVKRRLRDCSNNFGLEVFPMLLHCDCRIFITKLQLAYTGHTPESLLVASW